MKLGLTGFFGDISNFLKGAKVVGVDIGTASVKIVELTKRRERIELLNYGILELKEYLEHPNLALQADSLKLDEKKAARLLSTLLRETKITTKTALVAIPAFSSFSTVLEMPLLTLKETEQAVTFQARQFIPLPPDLVSVDWTKIEETENQRGQKFQKILLIGIPNEVIDSYKRILKEVGLQATALELESIALIRALSSMDKRPTLLLDIGAEATNIVVSENSSLKHSEQTNKGALYLTHALQSSLGLSMTRAEELKRRKGLLGKGGELELSTLLLSFLDVIIEEARKVKDVYESRYGRKVERLIVSGGGANMAGIETYISTQMAIPYSQPPTFLDVAYDGALEPVQKNLSAELAVAVGVARRYFQ